MTYRIPYCILLFIIYSCSSTSGNEKTGEEVKQQENGDSKPDTQNNVHNEKIDFYYGADLSYANEMDDCGARFKDAKGETKDVYAIFHQAGANLVRVRLWNNPTWTNYSNLEDVKKTIRRAKDLGMSVLLDFHYSDTWADPDHQLIPSAWELHINNTEKLAQLLYDYTYGVLEELYNLKLSPDLVQIGNEINPMILQTEELKWPINWDRNATLINKGIKAVRDIADEKTIKMEVMLHIAQPENGLWWFEQANENGVKDYDWIGLSYYPLWSEYQLRDLAAPLKTLKETYNKKLMIVETAYPFTLQNADEADNVLGETALIPGYPASQQGQLDYLKKVTEITKSIGGQGVVYWEPSWVSTDCRTKWAKGSHWDNATLFDNENKATLAMGFYGGE